MKCVEVYKELYHQEPFDVAFCPYRISPLGAHIDHQYGKINGLAIDKGIHMAYHPKQNGVVELQSLNFPKRAQFFVNAVPEEKQGDWADHLRGAAKMLGEKYRLKVGLSGIIEGIPIINGLTDFCHPCQVLADLMTIREKYGVLKGLKMCYIGDGNNMANSLIVGGLKSDMQVSIATPDNYRPAKEVLDFAAGNDAFTLVNDPIKAVENADVVITDTWTSMGQEEEKKIRQQAFQGYQINDELMAAAKPGAMVMHCLPAYRGQEITEKIFEEHASEIFEEAENRLHAQKAVMVTLMK